MFQVLTCLTTEHDLRVVLLAGVVCFLASLATINLYRRAMLTRGPARTTWIVAAGVTAGFGIWSTHFVAMLAYEPGVPVAYGIGLTSLSLLAAISITGIGLSVALYGRSLIETAAGGGIVGAGIASMHYLGMFAVELPGRIAWSPGIAATSIAAGIVLGMAALAVVSRRSDLRGTMMAAVLLTLAIVAHHFIAMGAVIVVPDPTRAVRALSLSPGSLAIAVAGVAASVLTVSLASAYVDSRMGERNTYRIALDHLTQGFCMWDRHARLVLCNRRYIDMYGMSSDVVKPGVTMREVLLHRKQVGSFKDDPDQYIADILIGLAKASPTPKIVPLPDGRTIKIAEQRLADGGWVATLDDVTVEHNTEKRRGEQQAHDQRRHAVDSAIGAFRGRMDTVLATVGESTAALRSTASSLFAASEQTSHRAQGALQASNAASTNAVSASTATAELSGSIGEIARQLVHAADIVKLTVKEAQSTNDDIKGLADAARKIGDIVELIRSIAEQTNLLALNATIEAARAGDAGRGFAVVASEVKSLAVQTAKATEDIGSQIRGVQQSTGNTVEAIARITQRMREIDQYASAAAAAVEEQNAATEEISHNVAGAAQGTNEIVVALDQVAGAASETRQSAETVLGASKSVNDAVAHLRHEVEGFLAKVAV